MLLVALFVSFLAAVPVAQAQAIASDSKGADLLRQVLQAAGVSATPLSSFTASGTITYFWAGQPVQGSASLKARGAEQFRLDAQLPDGARSFVSSRRGGGRKAPDGKLTVIPAHNTAAIAVPTLPYPGIAASLSDAAAVISYEGESTSRGRPLYQVRVRRMLPREADPDGRLSDLFRTDYFIDPQTHQIVRVEDLTHPVENVAESYPRAIEMESYAVKSGIAVPTLVRETVAGQLTWEFRLAGITFNDNVREEDFDLR